MTVKLHIISIVLSLGLLALIFELVRRKLLKENYSLTWFFVSVVFLLFSIFGNRLGGLASFLGFYQASNAIIVYAIFLLLIILLGISVAISRISDLTQTLAQEIGLLKNRLNENLEKRDKE
ncbi:MAG: DUF2304 domain-containing protein [Nitrospinota bacterium]